MKFLDKSNYADEVKACFDNDAPLNIAVAFWGIDSLSLFKSNKKIRIICNLESTGCNPKAIEKIMDKTNVEIKTLRTLHAKILVQNDVAIVGSANISINGLSLEKDETIGWHEAGIKTTDAETIKETDSFFKKMWELSKNIEKSELDKYKELWKNRRKNRPLLNKKASLLESAMSDIEVFKEREIYFVIYTNEKLSEEAEKTFENAKEQYSALSKEVGCYEDWSDLPDNAFLIDIYYGPKEGVYVNGLYETPSDPLVETFESADGLDGNIKLCFKKKNIFDLKLTGDDYELIKKNIKSLLSYHQCGDIGCIIPFIDGIKALKNKI